MPKVFGTGSISFSTVKSYFGTNSNFGSLRGLAADIPTTGAISLSSIRNQVAPIAPCAWYDARADFSLTYDGSRKVSQWSDKSGCNYYINQTNSTQQPTYSNNGFDGVRPAIVLTQGTSLMTFASNMYALSTTSPYTVFCVAEHNTNIPYGFTIGTASLFDGNIAAPTDFKFQLSLNNSNVNSNTVQLFGRTGVWTVQGQPTYSGKCLQGLVHGGWSNHTYLLLNNSLPVSLSNYNDIPSLAASSTQFMIGNNSNTLNRNVPKIAEVLMYNKELSIHERLSTERYLTEKWGLFPIEVAGLTTNATGVYCAKRMTASYKGPTIRLRRALDNIELDFYSDCFGNLGTQYNGEGTSLLSWGSNMLLYVRTLYDQSGNSNHVAQSVQANQPFFNAFDYSIDFGTTSSQFLTVSGSPFLLTDSSYSIIYRHGQFNNIVDGGFISIGDGTASSTLSVRANNTSYAVDKGGAAYTFGALSNTLPTTVTLQKDSTNTLTGFVNGIQFASASTSLVAPSSYTRYIGRTIGGSYINGSLFFVVFTNNSVSTSSRVALEQNTTHACLTDKIINSFPTYQRYDASTIPSLSTTVPLWTSSHNDGGAGRNATGGGITLPTYARSNGFPEVRFLQNNNQFFQIGTLAYNWMNSNGGFTIAVCAKFTNPSINQPLYEISNNTQSGGNRDTLLVKVGSTVYNPACNLYDLATYVTNVATTVTTFAIPGAALNNQDFHTYVITYNIESPRRSYIRMYIDGNISDVSAFAGNPYVNRTTIYNLIGKSFNAPTKWFDGSIRELIVYKTNLSDDNVSAVANALTVKWGMPRKYPPASLASAGLGLIVRTTLQNLPYGNGEYVISASSQNGTIPPMYVFDGDLNTRWITPSGIYSSAGGAYLGNKTTTVSGVSQAGEWIQLQIPEAIVPVRFLLCESAATNAVSLVIAGSNDGVTWTSLYDVTNRLEMDTMSPCVMENFQNSSTAFSYFRYICRVKNTKYTQTTHALYEFAIYGY